MNKALIVATAGLRKEQLADTEHVLYPRVDYLEMARRTGATVLNYSLYDRLAIGSALRQMETKVRSDLTLSCAALLMARQHGVVLAMSERAGIPLAGFKKAHLLRNPLVFRFQAWSERQRRVIGGLRLLSACDVVIPMNAAFADYLCAETRAPRERIRTLPTYSVDHHFFKPIKAETMEGIFSIGEVRGRDYKTLIEAVRSLPNVHLHIAASGSWYAREKNCDLDVEIPNNVKIGGGYSLAQLRGIYAQSLFVVLPIHDLVFPAGATSLLESMAMGKAVIISRSRGIMDYVVDGEIALLVEPENPVALREAIEHLLANPLEARRLGDNARRWIEERMNFDLYVERMIEILETATRAA